MAWLFCFSDLKVEPQYLSLGFHYLCYIPPQMWRNCEVYTLLASCFVTIVIYRSHCCMQFLSVLNHPSLIFPVHFHSKVINRVRLLPVVIPQMPLYWFPFGAKSSFLPKIQVPP